MEPHQQWQQKAFKTTMFFGNTTDCIQNISLLAVPSMGTNLNFYNTLIKWAHSILAIIPVIPKCLCNLDSYIKCLNNVACLTFFFIISGVDGLLSISRHTPSTTPNIIMCPWIQFSHFFWNIRFSCETFLKAHILNDDNLLTIPPV